MATLLKRCKVIVWDEATLSNKLALEAVEHTFHTRNLETLCMVFNGDFRQTLPVVRGGTRASEFQSYGSMFKL